MTDKVQKPTNSECYTIVNPSDSACRYVFSIETVQHQTVGQLITEKLGSIWKGAAVG
jgi:hypothetical protein